MFPLFKIIFHHLYVSTIYMFPRINTNTSNKLRFEFYCKNQLFLLEISISDQISQFQKTFKLTTCQHSKRSPRTSWVEELLSQLRLQAPHTRGKESPPSPQACRSLLFWGCPPTQWYEGKRRWRRDWFVFLYRCRKRRNQCLKSSTNN